MINQLSIFLENSQGRLAHATRILGDAGVNLLALSIADTASYGVLRVIVSDPALAMQVLKKAGFTAHTTPVLAVLIPDHPGSLADLLALLRDGGVNVEYLYSFLLRNQNDPLMLLKVDMPKLACRILAQAGVRLLEHDDLA